MFDNSITYTLIGFSLHSTLLPALSRFSPHRHFYVGSEFCMHSGSHTHLKKSLQRVPPSCSPFRVRSGGSQKNIASHRLCEDYAVSKSVVSGVQGCRGAETVRWKGETFIILSRKLCQIKILFYNADVLHSMY